MSANGISGFRVSACERNFGIPGQRLRMEFWDSGSAPANGISGFRVSACESQLAMAVAIVSLGIHEIPNRKTVDPSASCVFPNDGQLKHCVELLFVKAKEGAEQNYGCSGNSS